MKRRTIIYTSIAVIIFLMLCIKPILKLSSKIFWNTVVTQFDMEEKKRQQKVKNGEIVMGKDTVLVWGNMYEIGHYSDGNNLEIAVNDIFETILERITIHKIVNETLYIISDEGYATIDKDNLCKVYIIIPENDFVNGYSIDEYGNQVGYSRFIENENVQYLSQYNEFSAEEQEVFADLKEK